MCKLHAQLESSEPFYTSFQMDFEFEVDATKMQFKSQHLRPDMAKQHQGSKGRKIDGQSIREPRLAGDVSWFADHQHDMHGAVANALSSAHTLDPNKNDLNETYCGNANRLYDKLMLANEHLRQLLKDVRLSREDCVMLVAEIKLLMWSIDTEEEGNRALFARPTMMMITADRWMTTTDEQMYRR